MSIATSSPTAKDRTCRNLGIALWIAQAALFAMFLFSGWLKVSLPIAELAKLMSIATVLGEPMTRFIGVCELLGAIGVMLPAVTRIKPLLTPIAAAGLCVMMVLGAAYHLRQGEPGSIPIPLVLGATAAFIAWGRFFVAPIASGAGSRAPLRAR